MRQAGGRFSPQFVIVAIAALSACGSDDVATAVDGDEAIDTTVNGATTNAVTLDSTAAADASTDVVGTTNTTARHRKMQSKTDRVHQAVRSSVWLQQCHVRQSLFGCERRTQHHVEGRAPQQAPRLL